MVMEYFPFPFRTTSTALSSRIETTRNVSNDDNNHVYFLAGDLSELRKFGAIDETDVIEFIDKVF
tara:strand:- start:2056 stop:2250 length:195 start_codon:yes stop_codon:yes gene_type:complete